MRMVTTLGAALVGVALSAGPAVAGEEPKSPAPPAPAGQALILSIRARTFGVITEMPSGSDVEPMRAPTGEGVSRMPSATTEVARGVYLTVMPACIPGVDEPFWPAPYRHPIRRR